MPKCRKGASLNHYAKLTQIIDRNLVAERARQLP